MILRLSKNAIRYLLIVSGALCFILGVIGAFLPIMPTVPFMLLSAYFFSRGSPRLHQWLLSRPHVGPVIEDWEKYRVIRPRQKAMAVLGMIVLISYPVFFQQMPRMLKLLIVVIAISVSAFVLRCPSSKD